MATYRTDHNQTWHDGVLVSDVTVQTDITAEVQHDRLTNSIATLRAWAVTADTTTATAGNAVAVVNGILDNLAIFYSNFADLLELTLTK